MRNEEKNDIPHEERGKFEESLILIFSPVLLDFGVLLHFYVTIFGHFLETQEMFFLSKPNFA